MFEPYPHRMMPRASHDELARQNYVAAFKIHAEEEVYPKSKDVYRARVAPAVAKATGQIGRAHV